MRLLRRLAALAGVVLAMILLGASRAAAGGPTSVLVVSPDSGQAASLYHTAARYQELAKHLGPGEAHGVRKRPLEIDGAVDEGGTWRRLTVTWLRHDVSVWRVDRVHLPKQGGPIWVSTQTEGQLVPAERWHLADEPAKLRALLDRLGVLGKAGAVGAAGVGGGGFPPDFVSRSEAEERESEAAVREDAEPEAASPGAAESGVAAPGRSGDRAGSADWWWPIPGLAAGALIGFAGVTLVRRGTARREPGHQDPGPPGPRRQLIDM
ncbi:hypothetical protein [Streptomyces sp. ISL-100]|uniref:hypothetical protein n=1 Tax=Streptomyces sp. ISL-100 TaxID=2819173 RepID=UPI001BE73B21|nr:hypothetical protein [Streptomyces sp. ISL-100]MBT2396594.1 hypothetical protein [Streptomyces sp. ISL-100]